MNVIKLNKGWLLAAIFCLLVMLLLSGQAFSQVPRKGSVTPAVFLGAAPKEQSFKTKVKADTSGGLHLSIKKKWVPFRGSDMDEKCTQYKITKPLKKDPVEKAIRDTYAEDLCDNLINEIENETYDRPLGGGPDQEDNLTKLYEYFDFESVMDVSDPVNKPVNCMEVYKKFIEDSNSTSSVITGPDSLIPDMPGHRMRLYKPVIDKCKSYCKGVAVSNYESKVICGIDYAPPSSGVVYDDAPKSDAESCVTKLSNAEQGFDSKQCRAVCKDMEKEGTVFITNAEYPGCLDNCDNSAGCSITVCENNCSAPSSYCNDATKVPAAETSKCISACKQGCISTTSSTCLEASVNYCMDQCGTVDMQSLGDPDACRATCNDVHDPTKGESFGEFVKTKIDEKEYCYYYLNQWISKEDLTNAEKISYQAAIDNYSFKGSYIWYCFDNWYSNQSLRTPHCCNYIDYMYLYDDREIEDYYCSCTNEWSSNYNTDGSEKYIAAGAPSCTP